MFPFCIQINMDMSTAIRLSGADTHQVAASYDHLSHHRCAVVLECVTTVGILVAQTDVSQKNICRECRNVAVQLQQGSLQSHCPDKLSAENESENVSLTDKPCLTVECQLDNKLTEITSELYF